MFKKLNLLVVALFAVSFVAVSAQAAPAETEKCLKRIAEDGCTLSNNSIKRIKGGTDKCKHVQNGKDELEVFLQKESKDVVIIQTKGDGLRRGECPITKYEIDKQRYNNDSGIADFKILAGKKGEGRFDGQKVFLLSESGKLFIMDQDQNFYEVKTGSDRSYRNTSDLKLIDGEVRLFGADGAPKDGIALDMDDIQKRFRQGKVEPLTFTRYKSDRDVWRDETIQGKPVRGF